ncbi:MAG: MMPL family transporter [Planctomycetota bacterium]
MEAWAGFIEQRRFVILGLLAVILIYAATTVSRLQFDFSILPLIEANDEVRRAVDQFDADVPFQSFDQIVTLTWPAPIKGDQLAGIEQKLRALETDPAVASVFSIFRCPLVEPATFPPRLRSFRDEVGSGDPLAVARRHPLVMQKLFAADGHSLALFVTAAERANEKAPNFQAQLESKIDRLFPSDVTRRFVGGAAANDAMVGYMKRDLGRGLLIQFVLFSILLPFVFRSLRGAFIPLFCVLSADLMAVMIAVHTKTVVGLIDLAVPGIIAMIGICDAIHMLHHFEEAIRQGQSKSQALRAMMRRVGPACFFTSLTTAIGFLSLLVAEHHAVRTFGVKASCAVLMTFVMVMTLLPALLSVWPVKSAALPRIPGLRKLGYGRPRLTYGLFALLVLVSVVGIQRLVIDSRWLEEMPQDDPAVQNLSWFEQNFAGLLSLDVRLTGNLDDGAAILAVDRFQQSVLALPGIRGGESYVDWIKEATGQPQPFRAQEAQLGASYLKLAKNWFPAHTVNPDFRTGRMTFYTADDGTLKFFARRDAINRLAVELPPGVKAEVAGYMVMAHESSRLVVTTMLQSFLVSLLAITLLIVVIYRSWRIGLISIVPNTIPILVALGLNGWLGLPLRIGIVMIYSLGLGLAVDDTIHILTRFRQEQARNPKERPRVFLTRALRSSGAALITTSMILFLASATWLPSEFSSLRDTGILLGTIVVVALVADLFLLPLLWEAALRKDGDRKSGASATPEAEADLD